MIRGRTAKFAFVCAVVVVSLGFADFAQACAVCFGDPDAPMARGAASGVIVLAALVYCVLLSFGGITLFWLVKAQRRGHTAIPANADHLD